LGLLMMNSGEPMTGNLLLQHGGSVDIGLERFNGFQPLARIGKAPAAIV
jgi:hypothetical protein